jgi:hypothetical protein
MVHDAEIILFLDVADTARTSIEVIELYETEADDVTLVTPFALKADWRIQITKRVEDLLFSLSDRDTTAISALLAQDAFIITRPEEVGNEGTPPIFGRCPSIVW